MNGYQAQERAVEVHRVDWDGAMRATHKETTWLFSKEHVRTDDNLILTRHRDWDDYNVVGNRFYFAPAGDGHLLRFRRFHKHGELAKSLGPHETAGEPGSSLWEASTTVVLKE